MSWGGGGRAEEESSSRRRREREEEEEEGGREKTERKRMREEIAVWAEIRLLHFLGRKWIRSGRVAACSSH